MITRKVKTLKRPSSGTSTQRSSPRQTPSNTIQQPQTEARKKGELCFRCNFESGNLSKVQIASDIEYDLFVRPDTNNGAYRLWFYFSVSNVKKNQKVLFTICNFSKARSLYRQGMTPIVKSDTRPGWERLPEKFVYYYRSNRHNKNYVLSFFFMFDREDDVYYFAYCYPYTYTDLQKFLYCIQAKNLPYCKRELIGRSEQYRRLDLLTITEPENLLPENISRKKTIFVTARVHPGETPSSYVCHGLIAFLVSDSPYAKTLREMCIFKIIPMLNPDGVFLGNYRCAASGFDLNRVWLNPQEYAHPTIVATRNLLLKMKTEENLDVDFFIDIHSHSNATSGFMYMNHMNDRDSELLFPKLLDYKAKEFSFSDSRCCKDPTKLGTGRRALGEMLQIAKHCYTLEVSFYSYTDAGSKSVPFTEENYSMCPPLSYIELVELGRNMAITFLDYYTIQQQQTANGSLRKILRQTQ